MDKYGKCPICNMDWCGGDIPEEIREHYAPPYKWSRLISVEIWGTYDGAIMKKCPECLSTWARFTGKLLYTGTGAELTKKEIERLHKEAVKEFKTWMRRPLNETDQL